MQLESTLDLRFGRHFRADVWSIKFFQGVATGADLVKTPVISVATKFGKYAPGALVIPSSETVISLAVKHQIRTPHAVKIAIAEPEEGAAESWVKTFQWLWLPKTQVCAQPVVNTCMIFFYFFLLFFYFTNNLSYNNYLFYEYLINKNLTAATALTPPPPPPPPPP
ncbi:hypothetical protein T492DRAFT_138122, partial [Pavlovales sp. CCMP2436]